MKSLLVYCPNPTDGTSLYRAIGPFAQLAKTTEDLRLSFVDQINWATVSIPDVVFLQRPFSDKHVQMADICNINNKPVWVDYDDDLTDVPADNPTWKMYGKERMKQNIAELIVRADVVTVSSQSLKHKFKDLNQNIHVIPNAFDSRRFERSIRKKDREKIILWRGSETHVKDLLTYTPEIAQVAQEHPDWTWVFLGFYPWMLSGAISKEKFVYYDAMDPIVYFQTIKKIEPNIMMVPLWNCPFNEAKSNIGWIEATYAGAACMGPDMPEWRRPGVTTYTNREGFYKALKALIAAPEEYKAAMVDQSWRYIEDHLLLTQVNKLRASVLNGFYSKIKA